MYYKNRYYDTEIGRFLTRDWVGNPGKVEGLNKKSAKLAALLVAKSIFPDIMKKAYRKAAKNKSLATDFVYSAMPPSVVNYADGMNLYAYSVQNPINYLDAPGFWSYNWNDYNWGDGFCDDVFGIPYAMWDDIEDDFEKEIKAQAKATAGCILCTAECIVIGSLGDFLVEAAAKKAADAALVKATAALASDATRKAFIVKSVYDGIKCVSKCSKGEYTRPSLSLPSSTRKSDYYYDNWFKYGY